MGGAVATADYMSTGAEGRVDLSLTAQGTCQSLLQPLEFLLAGLIQGLLLVLHQCVSGWGRAGALGVPLSYCAVKRSSGSIVHLLRSALDVKNVLLAQADAFAEEERGQVTHEVEAVLSHHSTRHCVASERVK